MSHKTDINDVTINVSYDNKDDAKANGAFFNFNSKTWYIPRGEKNPNYDYLFNKYNESLKIKKGKKIYLNVPYDEKDDAKSQGAWFDVENKSWYTWSDNKNKDLLIELYT
jgi:hypothetical protein